MKNVALMTVFNTIQWWYTWQWLTFFGQPVYILGKIRQVIVVIYNLKHETCTVPLLRDCTLHDIFRAIVVSRILYAAPAWLGTWECVHHQLIVAVLTRFCVAANASATGTVATTCLLSLSCLTLLTMLFFNRIKINSSHVLYIHICLTNSIYLTNFESAHTTKLLSIKQNCSIVQISSYVCCTNTPIKST